MKVIMQISLVLPAFNEEKHIKSTLEFLLKSNHIDEIIVVNDGSTDKTADICASFKGIKVINVPKNKGKTHAVFTGVKEATYEHIFLFDADLLGLKQEYIERLIKKYKDGNDMVIMDYGGMSWYFYSFTKMATALSGVRILHKKHFTKLPFKSKESFELETAINTYFLKNNLTIAVSKAETLKTPSKYMKYNFIPALVGTLGSFKDYMFMYGIKGIPFILESWHKIYNLRDPS